MVTLYMTNEGIKIMDAEYQRKKLKVSHVEFIPLAPGIMDDGEILRPEELKAVLAGLPPKTKKKLRNVKLILDSHRFPVNKMIIPKMPESKVLKYIEGEYHNKVSQDEKWLYDYMLIHDKGKGQAILATAVAQSYVDSYINLLAEVKIKPYSIDFDIGCVIQFAKVGIGSRSENCMMISLDGEYISVYLFVRGEYHYLISKKSMAPRGTPDFYEEVTTTMSTVNQYSYAETQGELIEKVYMISVNEGEIKACDELCEFFRQAISLPIDKMTPAHAGIKVTKRTNFEMAQYVHNIGATIE